MLEVWKNINDYYQVSNKGRVKTLDRSVVRSDGKIIKSIVYCCKGKLYKSVGGYKWEYSEK